MESISIAEVIAPQQAWDYFLYVVMVLQIILLALLFSGSLRDVIFIAITVMCAVADKAYLFGFVEGGAKTLEAAIAFHTKESFLTYAARITMFALPLVIITQTKIRKAKPAAVVTAITAMVYTFSRWFFQQFPEGKKDFNNQLPSFQDSVTVASMSVTMLTYAWLRWRGRGLP